MIRRALPSLIGLAGILGCAPTAGNFPPPTPAPETTPEPIVVPGIPRNDRNMVWKIAPTPQTNSYRAVLKATVEEKSQHDNRMDSFTTTTDFSLKLTRSSNRLEISGVIFAIENNANQTSQFFRKSLPHPMSFDGNVSDHIVSVRITRPDQSSSTTPCSDSSESALSIISRDLIIVPQEITVGKDWQDSTTNLVCSGSLPVLVSVIRKFKIIGETTVDGIAALKLERTEKSVTSGEGSQGQHQISLKGTGMGTGQIYIDASTGLLLGLTATSRSELLITSSGRSQNFTQTTEENVVRQSLQ